MIVGDASCVTRVRRVYDPLGRYSERRLILGQTWRVYNFGDARFSPSLSQFDSGSGGVRHDIATDRLLVVAKPHPVHLSRHLIGQHNRYTKGVRQLEQATQELRQVHLARCQFGATGIICSNWWVVLHCYCKVRLQPV